MDGEKTDMKNKKKIIGNGIFLFLVLGLTLYGVFHGEDLGLIWEKCQKKRIIAISSRQSSV